MDSILNINIYGLQATIHCDSPEERREISSLLSMFLNNGVMECGMNLDFRKKESTQEIGSLLFSHLARKGIWAMHSGGFHFWGGHLTVGPSDCGKSTFSHMAMMNGFDLLSDDITLLRETPSGVEMLPLYSKMYLKTAIIEPEPERYRPAILKYLLLPKPNSKSLSVRRIEKKIDLLKKLVAQFLWSYEKHEQQKQKAFLERMCQYPAYEVYWDLGMLHDRKLFRMMLDEIVQSKG